jgi:hypothetical protein
VDVKALIIIKLISKLKTNGTAIMLVLTGSESTTTLIICIRQWLHCLCYPIMLDGTRLCLLVLQLLILTMSGKMGLIHIGYFTLSFSWSLAPSSYLISSLELS